jgi:hypothetical protein
MLFTIVNWLLIFFTCGVLGLTIIRLTYRDFLESDSGLILMLSQVIGLLSLALFLLFLSIFIPVGIECFLFALLVSCFIYYFSKEIKLKFIKIIFDFLKIGIFRSFVLLALVAIYSSQIIFWGDSANYHINAIRWIHEIGIVYGIANLIGQLGFVSSWFALNSSLQLDNFLVGRSYAILGGYVLFLICAHFFYSLYQISLKKGNTQSFFYIYSYIILIILLFRWGVAISPSPDVIINLSGILFITVLIGSGDIKKKILLLYIISILFFNIKLSSLSLLIYVFILLIINFEFNLFKKVIFLSLLLIPILLANYITSGYLFYPSYFFAMNADWAVPIKNLNMVTNSIFNHAFYNITDGNGIKSIGFQDLLNWMMGRKEFITTFLIILNIISIIYFFINAHSRYYLIIQFSIISFIIFSFNAPTLRFGLYWLLLLPSLFMSHVTAKYLDLIINQNIYKIITSIFLATILLIIIYPINPIQKLIKNKYQDLNTINLILPPRLLLFQNISEKGSGVVSSVEDLEFESFMIDGTIFYRGKGYCWDYKLPCSENEKVRLIDPISGIENGFRIEK